MEYREFINNERLESMLRFLEMEFQNAKKVINDKKNEIEKSEYKEIALNYIFDLSKLIYDTIKLINKDSRRDDEGEKKYEKHQN